MMGKEKHTYVHNSTGHLWHAESVGAPSIFDNIDVVVLEFSSVVGEHVLLFLFSCTPVCPELIG